MKQSYLFNEAYFYNSIKIYYYIIFSTSQLFIICLTHYYSQPIKKQKQYYKNKTDGRYSVEAVATLWMDQIKLPTTFKCELFIKEANYTSIKTYVYNGKQYDIIIIIIIKSCPCNSYKILVKFKLIIIKNFIQLYNYEY